MIQMTMVDIWIASGYILLFVFILVLENILVKKQQDEERTHIEMDNRLVGSDRSAVERQLTFLPTQETH